MDVGALYGGGGCCEGRVWVGCVVGAVLVEWFRGFQTCVLIVREGGDICDVIRRYGTDLGGMNCRWVAWVQRDDRVERRYRGIDTSINWEACEHGVLDWVDVHWQKDITCETGPIHFRDLAIIERVNFDPSVCAVVMFDTSGVAVTTEDEGRAAKREQGKDVLFCRAVGNVTPLYNCEWVRSMVVEPQVDGGISEPPIGSVV